MAGLSLTSGAATGSASSFVKLGGMDFVRFNGGAGRVGSPDFQNNPVRNYTAPPVLVGRDLVPNHEIDAYVAQMDGKTHGLVAVDPNGRMHLLARGSVNKDGSIISVPEASIVGSPDLTWAALTSVRAVRVVPPAGRLSKLSAAFTDPYSPASVVSLYEALGWCAWKSEVTGRPFMIPDEWLWESIATNGQGPDRKYPWGNEEPDANRARFKSDGPSRIGSHPSIEGVNDLAGNLWEWTMSPFEKTGDRMSVRGGVWNGDAQDLRSAYRVIFNPGNAYNVLGFRVVVPQDS